MTTHVQHFISGNEAVAHGVRLSRPQVIAAYPITPQTIVVERLAEMVENNELHTEFMHVESEHSALSAMIGASAVGARTFTATSSQGLLYMAECLPYASGGRFPVVMMNANRSVALPWSIYGDQSDSLSLLDTGWIQMYAKDAQESLDMVIQAYAIAEDPAVLTPVMINLDGFVLTHTYESVMIPDQKAVDAFLRPFQTDHKLDLDKPKSMAFSSTPAFSLELKYQQHKAVLDSRVVIERVSEEFCTQFGRYYGGLVEYYHCEDADAILLTLGSIAGTVRTVVDELRDEGKKVGYARIRFMRPFPSADIAQLVSGTKAVGVLEKDISYGFEGTVYTDVCSVAAQVPAHASLHNFIGGLGGRSIGNEDVRTIFDTLLGNSRNADTGNVTFVHMGVSID